MKKNVTRREFLSASQRSLFAYALSPLIFPQLVQAAQGAVPAASPVFVLIFMRGAADGLSIVPPIGDPHYRELRPNLALNASGEGAALPLDGHFGLHPALAPLKKYWDNATLAVINQVGSPNPTRSHFDAQDFVESGTPGVKSTADGFLNRSLLALHGTDPLQGVALQPNLPRMLYGRAPVIAFNSIREIAGHGALANVGISTGFESMYASAVDQSLRHSGSEAFRTLKALEGMSDENSAGANAYPAGPTGKRLREIAHLIKANVGVRVAATEISGWDTHVRQGAAQGQLATHLGELGQSLDAFAQDLGPAFGRVCVLTVTEFGRTVRENGTHGTDHGHGGLMFALGGTVKGRRMLGHWKDLRNENLYEGRDLLATTDHRDVFAEILAHHLRVPSLKEVFPGFTPARVGLFV